MNNFIITPFESVRTNSEMFRLDATFDSINQEWGEASKILIDNILRQTTEYRSACELIYENQGKKLTAVVCNKHTNPDLGVCIGGMGGKKIPKGEDRIAIAFARSEIEYYKMFVQV